MNVADIVLLGAALSADAFAVTISNCFVYGDEDRGRLLLMPVFFGGFQALMPYLGYMAGGLAAELIERYAGIVTLVILGIIGGNMIREGARALLAARRGDDLVRDAEAKEHQTGAHLTIGTLFLQAVATAIDAFAVGVSFRAQTVNILPTVCLIGATTAVFCIVALGIGRRLGDMLGERAEVVGGVVLVAIGLRAFLA